MSYVDGFVLIVSKKKLKAYKALAVKAAKVWMEHGAVGYHECVGEEFVGGRAQWMFQSTRR